MRPTLSGVDMTFWAAYNSPVKGNWYINIWNTSQSQSGECWCFSVKLQLLLGERTITDISSDSSINWGVSWDFACMDWWGLLCSYVMTDIVRCYELGWKKVCFSLYFNAIEICCPYMIWLHDCWNACVSVSLRWQAFVHMHV